ncbi:MAG: hypothetical protein GY749_20400, partial [Desulfobacteraceae bacterium]|nr:hypothetical protein [Desulfobacteraceae bacterium]
LNDATVLYLYDANGNQLALDEHGSNGTNDANASITHTFIESGTYYVMVKEDDYWGHWTGTYSLRILPKHDEAGASWDSENDNEPNDKLELANQILVGLENAQSHKLVSNISYVSRGSDTDWYHFNAEAGHTYVMETFNVQEISGKGPGVWLYDPNGNELANDEYGSKGMNDADASITHKFLTSGTYYLKVKDYSNVWTGSYSLRVCRDSCQ